jgi:O-antigen/teichoic acid export membrane protein
VDPDELFQETPNRARVGYIALRTVQYATLFLSALVVARALGPAGRAQYALPLALATVVLGVCHLTLEGAAGRLLARKEASLHELVSLLSATTLLVSAVAVVVTTAVGYAIADAVLAGASHTTVLLAALVVPFMLAAQVAGELLLRLGILRRLGVVAVVSATLQLALAVVLMAASLLTPERAMLITLIGFAVAGVATAAILASVSGLPALRPRLPPKLTRRVLSAALAFHPGTIALQLGARIDLLVVGAFASAHDAGLYSLSLTLADSIFLASYTLSQTALRTQTAAEESEAARFTFDFTRQSLYLSLAAAAVASLLAYPFITLVFGQDWRGSVLPFVILVIATIAITLEAPARTLLMRLARPSALSLLACVGLILNVGTTVVLVQALGIAGAALASMVAFWAYAFAILNLAAKVTGIPMKTIFGPPRRDDLLAQVPRLVWSLFKRPAPLRYPPDRAA